MLKCVICGAKNHSIQLHHVVLQATGGTDMPTVPLCSNCHTALHKLILQSISKRPKQIKYFTDEQMLQAKPLAEIAIVHIRRARENPNKTQLVNLGIKTERRIVEILHLLKSDAGFTNLNDFCNHVLKQYIINNT